MTDIPRINATVTATPYGLWEVAVWVIDDEADKAVYVLRAAGEDEAAREGMRRFLAERADRERSKNVGVRGA